ncbi:hypothetical protein [Azospirillum soli]|uniref:hypothetical protein n=1 Tax=Azospirillum soli TaxID=1304799 RepID=UPI001AEB0F87|nr:hypothetical protein [Azospirillum soli]MBP2312957.1 hypothetical protein [Azospirillum soli]
MTGRQFTRQELYDLVWSQPMRTLAAAVGVSDVALAKACRHAGIPVPGRGHWAKTRTGKPTTRRPLPARFPGASEIVDVGGKPWRGFAPEVSLETPLPPAPTFDEDRTALTERVRKMVGTVTVPRLATKPHRLIATLLEKDQARRDEYLRTGYSFDAPRHDSPVEKRRLRILNAIFLAAARAGCPASLDTSKYPRNPNEAGLQVGNQHVSFVLEPIGPRGKPSSASPRAPRMRLVVPSRSYGAPVLKSWEDSDTAPLESLIGAIVIDLIVAGETFHRENAVYRHQWLVQRKAELEEAERRRKIEEERLARERREKEAQERIERLVGQATTLRQADAIRAYVRLVIDRASDLPVARDDLDRWAAWALTEADRIDPLKNGTLLAELHTLRQRR